MADYEKGLLARVLFKRELQDVIDRRIEPKMLADEKSRKAFEFILDFYKKYGDVPSIDLVEQEFPELKLAYAKEPVGYYIDKLVEQYVRNHGSYIMTENARLLVTNPMNGLETLRSEFARLTVEANPTRDVNLVETMNDRKKRYLELKNLKGIDGYPTPWQVLNEACVTGDSMIYDVETGKMVRMDDFCKGNFNSVLSFTSDGIREKMVSFKGRVTDKECLKIKTNSGHEIEGTYEHPVLTPSGWKRLDEVEIGENIAVVSRYPEPKNVVKIPDEHVDLIALLLSEGYISDGHVSVSNTDPEIIEVIRKSAEKMGCVVKQYGRSWNIVFGGRPERKHRGKRGRFTKDRIHPVQKMIDEYGIKRVTADKKEIPDVIFRLNNEQLRRFIAVFWSGDGYVNCCNKGRRGENVIVGINLTSKKMIQQLRTLLLRFGIVTHYMEVPQRNERWKMQYRLLVPTEFHEKFLNTFDLLGRRGVVLKERLSRRKFEHRTKLRLSDEIKNNLRRRFEEKKSLGGAGSSGKGVIAKIRKCVDKNFESFEGCFVRRKGERSNVIEKRMLKAMLEVLDVQDYMWVVNDDIHWVEVVSIERTGVKTVYDVTVPGTHCFIANDVVVHNTMGWHPGEFISIVARPAVGKAEPLDARLWTENGSIRMGDVKVGDMIYGQDGRLHRVVGVFPQGEKMSYKVTFSDGSSVECCEEHLWTVRNRRKQTFETCMLKDIVENGLYDGEYMKWYVPMTQPVEFSKKELPLDPYVVGCLIAGGSLRGPVTFCNSEPDVVERFMRKLPAWADVGKAIKGREYPVRGICRELKLLGLRGKHSYEKFVPDAYKYSSVEDRVSFLQALFDCDGYAWNGELWQYSTSSERLAYDVRTIVESLGGTATIRKKVPVCTHNDEKSEGRTSYVMRIVLPTEFQCCINRKQGQRSVEKKLLEPYRSIVSVEAVGMKPMKCIMVDAPDQLYLTDHFVVTHNTFMLVVFAEYAWANGLSVLFINNEMSEEQIGKRFDAVHFKLPYKEFRAGLLPDELEKRYFEGLQELEGENPIWVISDVSGVMSIASKIDQYKPDIVMIDGMYLLNDDQKGDSRWERITNVSRDLKKLAQQKRVPIIATTQFNRATDETRVERVTLSNIGFSDSLGQDCLPKGTLIWSNRGIVRLDELDDEKDLVFDGETFRRFKLLKEKEKEVYEVRLKHSGQVFRCSGDHGLLVMSKKPELEWKKAKDLRPGDSVVQVESELSGERGARNYVPISKKMGFDEVESVVATGVVESMYDLSVEMSHRFVAEGLVVHNSDVVLGLFRTRDMELNNEMLVRMLKVREGQAVDFNLLWDLRRMDFKVIATQDENQFIDDEEGDEVDF